MRGPLLTEPGVLEDVPLLELDGWEAVARHGGAAMLRWRSEALAAAASGVTVVHSVMGARFHQAVVHVQKSKEATRWDIAQAWTAVMPGGRLVIQGENRLGAKSIIGALARELGGEPEHVVTRDRSRVAVFTRGEGPGPRAPGGAELVLPEASGGGTLMTRPGVFSAGELDAGTRRLLVELSSLDVEPPHEILDLACGVGPFAIAALRRWPAAHATLLDADRVAVDCASDNLSRMGLQARASVTWWDVSEPVPVRDCDLVLVNPPFHGPRSTDLDLGRRVLEIGASVLRTGGRMLVVANRHLPYEAVLAPWGRVSHRGGEQDGFKLLQLVR